MKTSTKVMSLRHALATLAYRGAKAVRGTPAGFARFQAAPGTRTPAEILAHIGDLMEWGIRLADGKYEWHDSRPLHWHREVERFFRTLKKLDQRLASRKALGFPAQKIFQGPISDALTHVGQINLLRRLARAPVRGENYSRAKIVPGRVGPRQATPAFEFD